MVKKTAKNDVEDDFDHIITSGQRYFVGRYLKEEKSHSVRQLKFSILPGRANCISDEVLEVFVDITENLTIEK